MTFVFNRDCLDPEEVHRRNHLTAILSGRIHGIDVLRVGRLMKQRIIVDLALMSGILLI